MHTVEKLEKAIAEAVKQGYEVRMEPLGGASGGLCEFGKRKWIFVDITASVVEQLEQVLSALRSERRKSDEKREPKAA
jgi:regulator of RNase E activity RraB